MGAKAKPNEITFNYPIPRALHAEIKKLSILNDTSVKDIMIEALQNYVDTHEVE